MDTDHTDNDEAGVKAHVGQRVRRATSHRLIPIGMLGTIDVVHDNGHDFWVATDEGGFCGWTNFDQWAPVTGDSA